MRAAGRGKVRSPSLERRSSGILLHLTSLPGPHGSGDLGPEAHRCIDFLAAAGQSWWQMLPVGPPGPLPSCSPYDSASAFAVSPWLVSLAALGRERLLDPRDLRPVPGFSSHRVNFRAVVRFREERLRRAFARFRARRGERGRDYRAFCDASADWLEDHALFAALRHESSGKPWTEHDAGLRERRPAALRAARERCADEVAFHRFVQHQLDRQWRSLREYARDRGIGLIGDLPIFIAHASADVWSHPDLFQLDRRGRSRRVSGYPGDPFNEYGQLWGHPQYDWPRHEETGFAWWARRFARMLELFDAVRIDHFLGFTRTWSVPAGAPDARSGRWLRSPGDKLLAAVERKLGRRPLIAEDLGLVTPADVRLREAHGLPSIRILQFGFDGEPGASVHLPHNYASRSVAYTGSHDNDTLVGWFRQLRPADRQRVETYLGECDGAPHLAAIRALMASPAAVVVFPMQDVLGLGHASRMNTPGTRLGNWRWRLGPGNLDAPARELRRLSQAFGRGGSR